MYPFQSIFLSVQGKLCFKGLHASKAIFLLLDYSPEAGIFA